MSPSSGDMLGGQPRAPSNSPHGKGLGSGIGNLWGSLPGSNSVILKSFNLSDKRECH
jgi:hypothetical protein